MSRGAGRALTAVGLAFAFVMIAGGTLSLVSLWWLRSEETTQTFTAASAIEITSNCGDVTVEGSDRSDITATTKIWWSFNKPTVAGAARDGVRELDISCPVSFGVADGARVTVQVPSTTDVTVHASAGSVTVRGLAGAVDVRSDAGAVEGSQLSAQTVQASSSAGAVRLSFTAAPQTVTAKSTADSVTVLLPPGSETYHVLTKSTSDSADVRVKTDPSSPRTINATSSAGAVLVDYVG